MTYPVPLPAETAVMTALRSFLQLILPTGTATFNGSIAGTTLTTAGIAGGSLAVGDAVLGEYVAPGTFIVAPIDILAGTYTISVAQSTPAPTLMWNGVPVVRGQVNRVPEPKQGDLVVMWPLFRKRLSTNVDTYDDVVFSGDIDGTTLTVSAVERGTIAPGQTISAVGIAPNTRILALGTGTGGMGTYVVTPAQTLAHRTLASGYENFLQPTEFTAQIDVHGPNAGNNAQLISTMFRDEWATSRFATLNPDVQPLHADDPRQIPFYNGEQQVENRWVITAVLQANETVQMPIEFADQLDVETINVQGAYPA